MLLKAIAKVSSDICDDISLIETIYEGLIIRNVMIYSATRKLVDNEPLDNHFRSEKIHQTHEFD